MTTAFALGCILFALTAIAMLRWRDLDWRIIAVAIWVSSGLILIPLAEVLAS